MKKVYRRRMAIPMSAVLFFVLAAGIAAAQGNPAQDNSGQSGPELYFQTEAGALKLLAHTYRVGAAPANDDFDFVRQGGQEILSFFERYSAGVVFSGRHDLVFLYQPLELNTEVRFKDDVTIDDKTFASGTPMNLTYSFPFYRFTYRYRFLASERGYLGSGAAVQFRNASIRFVDVSGEAANPVKMVVSQNLGIVPALSVAGRLELGRNGFAAFEATGSYASSSFFNGADFNFEGSILDASLRGGYVLSGGSELFANLRYFGGSAKGISQYPDLYWTESNSDETANVISALSLTLGMTMALR